MRLLAPLALLVVAGPAAAVNLPRFDRYGDPLPAGAVARLGSVYLSAANCGPIHFSADGKTLFAATDGPAVVEWDAATGKRIRGVMLPGEEGSFPTVCDDGSVAVVRLPGGGYRVVEVKSDRVRLDLPKEARPPALRTDTFSADGSRMFGSEGADDQERGRRLRVWDTATGKAMDVGEGGEFVRAHFSPDGTKLILREDDTAVCWDLTTGKRLWQAEDRRLNQFGMPGEPVLFRPDGRVVLVPVRVGDDDRAEVWDAATGKPVAGVAPFPADLRFPAAFTPDGTAVLTYHTGDDRSEYGLWDLTCGGWRSRLPSHWGWGGIAFDPAGRTAVSQTGEDRWPRFRRWDVTTGKDLYPVAVDRGHAGAVVNAAFDTTGQWVVSVGEDGTVREWDARSGRLIKVIATDPDDRLVDWSFDSEPHLAGRPAGGRATLVGISKGHFYPAFQPLDLAAGSAGRVVAYTSRAIDGGHGHYVPTGRPARLAGGLVRAPASPVPGSKEPPVFRIDIVDWDPATGRVARVKPIDIGPRPGRYWDSVHMSPDGNRVIDGPEVWDVETGRLIGSLTRGDIKGGAHAFSADGRFVAARMAREIPPKTRHGSPDWKPVGVWVWDTVTWAPVARLETEADRLEELPNGRPRYSTERLTPDGRFLLTLDQTGILVRDLAAGGRPVVRFRPDPRLLYHEGTWETNALDVSPDGRLAVTARQDGTCLVWDLSAAYKQAATAPPSDADLAAVWAGWGKPDGSPLAGLWRLADHPGRSVPFLRAKVAGLVKPVPPPAAADARKAVADLGSDDFAARETAEKRLADYGEAARAAVADALAGAPSPAARTRLGRVLGRLDA
ncbi:MAG: hypothetical protein K2X82_07560, partial [Gemmataceae bacterium]|nr:hypothetical protein [Gemmataceae bacterium]